jgi:hypothetical protein
LVRKAKTKETVYLKTDGPKEKVLLALSKVPGAVRVEIKNEDSDGAGYEIETAGVDIRPALTHLVIQHRWNILEISKTKASLEDVFRELTK